MPDLTATISGRLNNVQVDYSGTDAWDDMMPDTDTTSNIGVSDDHRATAIYTLFGYLAETITSAQSNMLIMSFDTSGIILPPNSATIRIYGHTNSTTGESGHSTDGVLGLKTTMTSTTELTTTDWGAIDQSGAGPILYTDTLTSWNVGTTTPNTFTLNSTALTDMANNDTFQIVFTHKGFYDYYDSNPPFAYGNNSPSGDNEYGQYVCGAYFQSEASYKPVLSYSYRALFISSNLTLNGGKLIIK